MNSLVMYDRETSSLWSQFLGEGVEGRFKGTKLQLVASQLLTWGEWKNQHPDTLLLDTGRSRPVRDSYMSYYFSGSAGIIGETNTDDRLGPKELVVGVLRETSQKAYPYRQLASNPVVNDTLDGRELVVIMELDGLATGVFDRRLDDRTLTFEQGAQPGDMNDSETGSTWDKLTGEAIEGSLKGKRLQKYPFIAAFWFAWTDFYPQTELYEPPEAP
jgi:hypothetical protein